MLKIEELNEMNQITAILAAGLNVDKTGDMPIEVAEAVESAKQQMSDLPQVIDDLNTAFNRYLTLSQTLGRMGQLARESSQMMEGPSDMTRREVLEEEFIALARVVAAEAGHHYFPGTSLTIANRISAIAAARILSYLDPVLDKLDHELRGQKEIIMEAISETINFMGIIARCYPDANGVEQLTQTLEKIKIPVKTDDPVLYLPTIH